MLEALNGATRLGLIVGDPIAQVKSPSNLTAILARRGVNAAVMPAHAPAGVFDTAIAGLKALQNVDALIITIPHKFAIVEHCDILTDRARFIGAVNAVRRMPDGRWQGDNFDGAGFVSGIRQAGWTVDDRPALLIGAGGAGSAIAWELLASGVGRLDIHDMDADRRDRLVARLDASSKGRVAQGDIADLAGYGLIVNATPAGMAQTDPLAIDTRAIGPDHFVGDVITAPEVTPLIAAARDRGAKTQIGRAMFEAQAEFLVDFLLHTDAQGVVAS